MPGQFWAQRLGSQCAGIFPSGGVDLVSLRQLELGPGVELFVQGLDLRDERVAQGHHLGHFHAVVGDLEREEVGEAQLAGDAVAEVPEPEQPVSQGLADGLRGGPGREPFVQVARIHEHAVDFVGRDGRLLALLVHEEREPVLRGRLPGLGLGAGLHHGGDRRGRLGRSQADLFKLADGQVIQLILASKQRLHAVNHLARADELVERLALGDLRGGVGLGHVGQGGPGGLVRGGLQREPAFHVLREESVGLLLGRGGVAPIPARPKGRARRRRPIGGIRAGVAWGRSWVRLRNQGGWLVRGSSWAERGSVHSPHEALRPAARRPPSRWGLQSPEPRPEGPFPPPGQSHPGCSISPRHPCPTNTAIGPGSSSVNVSQDRR